MNTADCQSKVTGYYFSYSLHWIFTMCGLLVSNTQQFTGDACTYSTCMYIETYNYEDIKIMYEDIYQYIYESH